MLEEHADLKQRDFWIWSRDDTHRYFLAGGGREDEFDALWSVAIGGIDRFDKAIAARTYARRGRRNRLSCRRQKARTQHGVSGPLFMRLPAAPRASAGRATLPPVARQPTHGLRRAQVSGNQRVDGRCVRERAHVAGAWITARRAGNNVGSSSAIARVGRGAWSPRMISTGMRKLA